MKQLVIIGASGHGKVVADIAKKNGYENIVFLDDNENLISCGTYPVIGKSDSFREYAGDVFVAIGNALVRQKIMEQIELAGRLIPVLIHPDTVIAEDVIIEHGTVVVAGAIINPGTHIGKGCIINTASSVDHDCDIKDYVHISVGSHIAGTVSLGEHTWIGAGTVVSNNVDICSDCVVGAGAVVVNDIKESGTYVGVPAKKI